MTPRHRSFRLQGFDYSRALIGLECLAAAKKSVEEAWEQVTTREAFGKKISKFEGVSFPLAEAETYIEAALPILDKVSGRADATYLRASMIHQICQHKDDEDFIFDLVKEDTTRMLYQVGTKHPNLTRALRRYAGHLKTHGQEEKLNELHNQFEKIFK